MNNAKLSLFIFPIQDFPLFYIFFKQKAKKEEKKKTHSIQYMLNSLSITHKLLDGFIKAYKRADFKGTVV
jgi:hypothetical protein